MNVAGRAEITFDQSADFAEMQILVIDSDLSHAHLVSRYIRQNFSTAIVETCRNASDALELCLSSQYSLLLVDNDLPDQNGLKFLHRLQSETSKQPPPAIVLTTDSPGSGAREAVRDAAKDAARDAVRANAYDFLSKRLVTKDSLGRSMKNAIAKHRLQRAVQQRTSELEKANLTLKERGREISEFYQTVSHEVKTPLAANREFVSLVRDGVLGSITNEQAEALDYALASCDQLTSHFNDLVEMSRLDAGKISLRKDLISINSVITRAMATCARAIEDKDINVTLPPVPDRDITLFIDGNRIIQVISNLLSNAVKYTDINGTIELSINKTQHFIEMCVADSGCGIEEKYLKSIFSRLFQIGDETHEYSGAGLGLGLSIALEIMVLHDGKIRVESESGIGSRFYIEIPHPI